MSKDDVEMKKLSPESQALADTPKVIVPPGRATGPLVLAVLAAALGSSFAFGYNIGVTNTPQGRVKCWIGELLNHNLTKIDGECSEYKDAYNSESTEREKIWSIVTSVFCIGGMVGGLLSGLVAEKFGRRGGMMLNNILAFMAAALMASSKPAGTYYLLIVGRLVVGINAGLNSGLSPMYLTEISPINLRGTIGSINQLMIVIGILVSNVIGLKTLFGSDSLWPFCFAFIVLPAVFQLVIFLFVPESPKHLFSTLHQVENAEKVLIKLRNSDDVKAEMNEMEVEYNKTKNAPKLKIADMFKNPMLRWCLFLAVMMMLAQQLSGINAAMFYSSAIFEDAGLSPETAIYATIGMGLINLVMTLISVVMVDRSGRRTLLLIGMVGMWFTTILFVIMLKLMEKGDDYKWASYVSVALVLVFVIFFATGPGSIPWFYVSELFQQDARSIANSVAVMTNWLANFIVALSYPLVNEAIGASSFLMFTGFLTIFTIFTFFFAPETKGKTVEEVVEELENKKRVV